MAKKAKGPKNKAAAKSKARKKKANKKTEEEKLADDRRRKYTGGSGQMLVMAELLFRECNAAVPTIDYGTDVFAFHDYTEQVARIQVKTAQGVPYQDGDGHRAQFDFPLKQLKYPDDPPLYYALVPRINNEWGDVVVISRADVNHIWLNNKDFGTVDKINNSLKVTIQFREEVKCSGVDLTPYRNNWESLPPVKALQEFPLIKIAQ